MRARALIVSRVGLAATAYVVLRGGGSVPQTPPAAVARPSAPARATVFVPVEDAKPLLEAHGADVPPELRAKSGADLAAAWAAWVSRHE